MVDQISKAEHGSDGKVMMKLFLKEEIEGMAEDRFDGSKDEHQIFVEVFYGINAADAGNSNGALRTSNFQSDEGGHPKASANSNCESALLTHRSSIRDPSANASEGEQINNRISSESVCFPESSASSAQPDVENGVVKQSTFSAVEQSDEKYSKPGYSSPEDGLVCSSKVTSSVPIQDSQQVHLQAPCCIVESFGQGILSNYFPFTGPENMDETGDVDDGIASSIECRKQNSVDCKVVMESKSVTSPISQESFTSGLMVAPVAPSEVPVCLNHCAQESSIPNLDTVDIASTRALIRDLPERLRLHAHKLLVDAGWKITPRVRSDRVKLAFNFIAPERGVIPSLSQAWKACGRILFASASPEQDDDGREWDNIDRFWCDLADALAYIERKTTISETPLSLLKRWQLLDPFVAVVCINKRIGVLREGRALKAVKSETLVLGGNKNKISVNESVDKFDHFPAHPNSSSPASLGQSILPVLESDLMPAVIKGSCSQQALSEQDCHEVVNRCRSRQTEQKSVDHDEIFKRSLKSLARSIGKGFCNSKSKHQTSFKASGCQVNKTNRSSSKIAVRQKDFHHISSGNCSADVFLIQDSSVQVSDASRSHDPKLAKSRIPSSHYGKLLASSESCEDFIIGEENSNVFDMDGGIAAGKVMGVEASISDLQHSAAKPVINLVKKVRKKSKKISEIEATELNCLYEGKCREGHSFCLDGRVNDHLELPPHQEEPDKLRWESTSGCFMQPVDLEEHQTPKVIMAGSIIKTQKKLSSKKSNLSQPKLPSLSRKVQNQVIDSKESIIASDNGCIPMELYDKNNSEVIPPHDQRVAKGKKYEVCKENKRKRPHRWHLDDDDLLITAIIKKKDFSSCNKDSALKPGASQSEALRKLKSQKGGFKLRLRTPGKGGKHSVDGKRFNLGARTVLRWLIEMGALSLKDVVQYRNPKNNAVVKDGWVTREGILCNCCTLMFSVSDFKVHAGSKIQKTASNLFLQSNKSYTLCQLQAWSAEYKARKGQRQVKEVEEVDQNDDTCGICGDGGELICCDNCPSTYHQACLLAQDVPEGSWYCHNCLCEICGKLADGKGLAVLECSQCERKYHYTCVKGKIVPNADVGTDVWFCGENCQEVYSGLRSRVGVVKCLDDGFSWSILRCNHDDQKVHSTQKIALMAECNVKLAVALTIMEECFVPMVDPRTGIDMIPHVLYNWGSNFARLNYQGFYTVVLEKGDEVISVASIRVHGITVAEMPLIATCSEHRRQGMCRRLMDAVEKMLKSFKVKMLVLSAIPNLVDTWTSGFGFRPIEDDEKKQLNHINLMIFPGTALLIKSLDEATAEKTGGKTNLYWKDGQSQYLDVFAEKNQIVTGTRATGNGGIDPDAETLLPISATMTVEVVDNQVENSHNSCCNTPLLATRHSEVGDASSIKSFSVKMGNSNTNGTNHSISTEQVATAHLSSATVHDAVHSCSGSFIAQATDNELPTKSSSNETDIFLGDTGEIMPPNANISFEAGSKDDLNMNNQRNLVNEDEENSFVKWKLVHEGDETEENSLVNASEVKYASFLSDEQAVEGQRLEVLNINEVNAEQLKSRNNVSADESYSTMSLQHFER